MGNYFFFKLTLIYIHKHWQWNIVIITYFYSFLIKQVFKNISYWNVQILKAKFIKYVHIRIIIT